jgi:hypothetical protein
MRFRLLTVTPLALSLLALVGCSSSDPAAPTLAPSRPLASRATPTLLRFTEPVTFTLAAGTCGLTTTVNGTGTITFVIEFTQRPDGSFNPAPILSTAIGTALGDDGSRYQFSYHNTNIVRDRTGGFSFPFTFSFVDVFHLVGAGSSPDVRVMQSGAITVLDPTTFVIDKYTVRGDPSCDPI